MLNIGSGMVFVTCFASGLLQGILDLAGDTVSDFPIPVLAVLALLVVFVDKGIVAFYRLC